MPYYPPRNAWETALTTISQFESRVAAPARRAMQKRRIELCLAEFNQWLGRLGPGSVCLDLGANIGTITAQMAATGATVHAFEPDPFAFGELTRNVGDLPNVVLHPAAVAATSGRAKLRRQNRFAADPVGYTITSTLGNHWPKLFEGGEEIDVEVRSFRDILAAIGGTVALVKIDIEGSELDILRDIFAHPATYDIDAIFCETHEFFDKSLTPEIEAMRRRSDALARPYINLYWP